MTARISGVIVAFNEETNIRWSVGSLVPWCDEVVVDRPGKRTTARREIARELGRAGRLAPQHADRRGIARLLGRAGDRRLDPAARRRRDDPRDAWRGGCARSRTPTTRPDVVMIPRVNVVLGRWARVGVKNWPNRHPRFFRRGAVTLERDDSPRHRGARIRHVAQKLPASNAAAIWHFSYESVADMMEKFDRYTSREARQWLDAGRPAATAARPAGPAGEVAVDELHSAEGVSGWRPGPDRGGCPRVLFVHAGREDVGPGAPRPATGGPRSGSGAACSSGYPTATCCGTGRRREPATELDPLHPSPCRWRCRERQASRPDLHRRHGPVGHDAACLAAGPPLGDRLRTGDGVLPVRSTDRPAPDHRRPELARAGGALPLGHRSRARRQRPACLRADRRRGAPRTQAQAALDPIGSRGDHRAVRQEPRQATLGGEDARARDARPRAAAALARLADRPRRARSAGRRRVTSERALRATVRGRIRVSLEAPGRGCAWLLPDGPAVGGRPLRGPGRRSGAHAARHLHAPRRGVRTADASGDQWGTCRRPG